MKLKQKRIMLSATLLLLQSPLWLCSSGQAQNVPETKAQRDELKPIDTTGNLANYHLAWQDEFNGVAVDTGIWMHRIGRRLSGINQVQNVRVAGGRMHVDFKKEVVDGKMEYTACGIIAKPLFGYGYYEVKSRLHRGNGLHSSFWTMGVSGDGVTAPRENTLTEIDGYEVDSITPDNVTFNRNLYIGRRSAHGFGTSKELDSSAGDFVAGFVWLPNKITFYRNGRPVGQIDTTKREFYGPQNLWRRRLLQEV